MNDFLAVVIILVIVLISVILHEIMHGVVAYWLGDKTAKYAGRLTLNPIKHIDPYMSIIVPVLLYIMHAPVFGGAKPVPVDGRNLRWREWGMAIVAIAGPLTNLVLAFLFFIIGHFSGLLYGSGGELPMFIFSEFVFVNLGFTIFNIIPIPPLDGSRVLYAIAPDGARIFLASMEQYGFIVVYALILLLGPVFSGIMSNGVNGILRFFYMLVGQ